MSALTTKQQAYRLGVLHYFNRHLREKEIITEKEYRAIQVKLMAMEHAAEK